MIMKERIEKFLRTIAIPLGATALVILYWRQYECQGYWWFPYVIGAILLAHYFFYFKKTRNATS
jgi:hypothetical protein